MIIIDVNIDKLDHISDKVTDETKIGILRSKLQIMQPKVEEKLIEKFKHSHFEYP